jgi:peptidoglycan/LPS O-acetylase OafA/YrhL
MKLRYIDALRGVAIMGVLIVHCGQKGSNENLPSLVQSIILNGAHGVQLFYVASAFTLFLSLANRKGLDNSPWFSFFVRRFFRIAPMYYLGICYYLWQDGFGPRYWLGDAPEVTGWNVLSNFTFLHGFNPYWITSVVPGGWSIAVEMFFYCMVPLLFLRIRSAQQALALVLITLLIRSVLQFILNRVHVIGSEQLWDHYLYMYLPSQLPVFALGILFYFIVRDNYRLSVSPLLILISFLVLAADLAGISLLPNHFLFAIAFVVLAIALSKSEFKLFVNSILVYIGKVSYSMYLVHFAVLYWMDKTGFVDFLPATGPMEAIINFGVRLLFLTAISVVVSTFFYHVIELPGLRLGSRLMLRQDRAKGKRELDPLPEPAYQATDKSVNTTIQLSNEK